jgi:hypothetical protein
MKLVILHLLLFHAVRRPVEWTRGGVRATPNAPVAS